MVKRFPDVKTCYKEISKELPVFYSFIVDILKIKSYCSVEADECILLGIRFPYGTEQIISFFGC